jgi:filamentous hemagglutinin family protein
MKRIALTKTTKADTVDTKSTGLRRRSGSVAIGMALAIVVAGPAVAGPTGGKVVAGEGSITTSGNLTRINQVTRRVSINWDTFNVASDETVRFLQPDSTSVALNTIFDQNPSQIFGTIDANGRVLLINPNGMIFGPTAQVNVAGLVASSLNISTADFMAGNYSFESAGGSGGLVLNQGTLQAAPGGFIALLGNAVANEGLIVADAGTIALGAGSKVALDFDGSGLIYFEVESDVLNSALGVDDAISNTGSLFADGGQVLLTARAAQDVYTQAINNEGLIQARRIENEGGVIRLSGGAGTTINTGTLDASGDAASDGGSIHVTGNYVGLAGDATLTADGGRNGGQVLVGGGYQGGDADVQNAQRTYVGSDVNISANAGANGDGGEVIVWSDDVTRYHGSISATGGSESGNGGNAEVSGAQSLGFDGYVDLTASNGETGLLLLDPALLTILGGDGGGGAAGGLDGNLPDMAFADSNGDDAVTADALEALDADIFLRAEDSIVIADQDLNGGDGNITIAADNNITLETRNSTVDGDSSGSISFSDTTNSIITQGTGSITITAGTVGTEGASITNTGILTTAGGAVTLTAAGDISVTADINSNGGAVTITADDNATLAAGATIATVAGDLNIRVDNANDSTDTLAVLGTITSSGTVTLAGSATNANDVLQGSDGGNTWVVDGANTGTLGGSDFDDFATLQGGAAADDFAITGAGSLSGSIDGALGANSLDVWTSPQRMVRSPLVWQIIRQRH